MSAVAVDVGARCNVPIPEEKQKIKPVVYDVRIGQKCKRCGKDFWRVKRAFKVCVCGMRCWTIRTMDGISTVYRYHQGEMAPPKAIVTSDEADNPYRGP